MRYRCKPDIFAQTYEPADAPASGEPSGADAAVREAWRSVTDSLPKPGADVIAGYRDTAGRWCSVRAVYAAARSVVCTCERDGDCFCEMDDTGESWWPEGWYEIADNADDVNTWRIRGTVTHWMPLPTAPEEWCESHGWPESRARNALREMPMTDTPQSAWMREYERLRSDLDNAAYDVGDARNGEEEERAEAVAAMARKALDAHVRGLVDALEEIAGLRMVAGKGFMPDSVSYLRPDQYYHRVQAIIARAALAAPKDAP